MDTAHALQTKTYYFTKAQVEDFQDVDLKEFLYQHGFDADKPIMLRDDILGVIAYQ